MWKDFFLTNWQGLLLLGTIFLAVCLPLYNYSQTHPGEFLERVDSVSILKNYTYDSLSKEVLKNIWTTLKQFHWWGDMNPRHNVPGKAIVHPLVGIFFPLGLMISLARWRKPTHLLVLLFFLAMMSGGFFTIEAPQALRTSGAAPIICFWAALSIRWLWGSFENSFPQWKKVTFGFFVFLCLFLGVVVGIGEYQVYFNQQVNTNKAWRFFDGKFTLIADYVNNAQGDFVVYSDGFDHNVPSLLNKQGTWKSHFFPESHLPIREMDRDVLFIIIEPDNRSDKLIWLRHLYPEGKEEKVKDPFGETAFVSFRVNREVYEMHRGVNVTYSTPENESWIEKNIDFFQTGRRNPFPQFPRSRISGKWSPGVLLGKC